MMRFVVVLLELCNGQQVCTAVTDGSFGEPCPALGSYLSVEYHCKERESCFIFTTFSVYLMFQCAVKGKTVFATKRCVFMEALPNKIMLW